MDLIFTCNWNGTSVVHGVEHRNNDLGATVDDITRIVDEALAHSRGFAREAAEIGRIHVVKGLHQYANPHITVRLANTLFHIITERQYTLSPDEEDFVDHYTFSKVIEGVPPPNGTGMIEVLPDERLPPPGPDGIVMLTREEAITYYSQREVA